MTEPVKFNWRDTTALVFSFFALVISSLSAWYAYRSFQVSQNSYFEQQPSFGFVSEEMIEDSKSKYHYSFAIKNFGGRAASNIQVTTYYVVENPVNNFVVMHRRRQPANDVQPSQVFTESGYVLISPEPQYVVMIIRYDDRAVNKTIYQKFFYWLIDSKNNQISPVSDIEIKNKLESLPGIKNPD